MQIKHNNLNDIINTVLSCENLISFQNKQISKQYLDEWIILFQSIKETTTKIDMQFFTYSFSINNIPVYLNFNVDSIINDFKKILERCNNYINTFEFTMPNKIINWTPSFFEKNEPSAIILVPLVLDKYERLLVIDGNNRLTTQIKKQVPKIKSLILSEKVFLSKNYFFNDLEYYLYIFINELSHIAESIHQNIPESIIFKKRFLNKHSFKFKDFKFDWI